MNPIPGAVIVIQAFGDLPGAHPSFPSPWPTPSAAETTTPISSFGNYVSNFSATTMNQAVQQKPEKSFMGFGEMMEASS
jgi:hypothetical protein